MASIFNDRKLMFLVAAAITVIAAGVLIANVQVASGQGVKIGNDVMDQLTSITIQIMVVFWIALFGYFLYRYFTTTKRTSRVKGERQAGEGRNMLPYAFVLLALWLILFVINPQGGGLFGGQGVNRSARPDNTTVTPDQPQLLRDVPLVLPMVVVLIAIVSIVVVWRFMRRGDGPQVKISNPSKDDEAKAVLQAAVISLYAGEDPRSTIIRTYQQMCLLVQVGKLEEEPYLTPREFADRAVAELGWKKGPLDELTSLFEEARYSGHVLGDVEKDRAIASFERVREGLGGETAARTAQ
jgi:hypothetical protein